MVFTVYVSPIGGLIDSYSISYHKYADDTQLYTALTTDGAALDSWRFDKMGYRSGFWTTIFFWTETSHK